MTRYEREKETMKRYAMSGKGKKKHREAKKKYRESLRGSVMRRVWNKNLPIKEQLRALEAFKRFNGRCQCCGSKRHGGRGWHLDHKDRKFRGILCHLCNCAAAFIRDSIKICRKLEKYLKRTK